MKKRHSIGFVPIMIFFIFTFFCFALVCCERKSENIVIGLVADLTGPMALYGGWVKNGAQIALNEISTQGGINGRSVDLKIEDSESSPKAAVSAIQKLITIDQIRLIVTGNGSSATMAMSPVANEKQAILFATLASSPSITNAGDYVFRNRLSGIFEAKNMARIAFKRGFQRVAVAAINNEAGVPYIDAFQQEFEGLGGVMVARELLMPGKTDFRSHVIKLKNAKPDAVFAVLQIEQAGYLMKQSTELGFKPKWLGISSLKSDELIEIAGYAAEGTIIASEGVDESNEKYVSFRRRYRKHFGKEPSIYAVNGYDAVMLLATIIGQVGVDPKNVKAALYEISDYVGAGGKLRFDSNGDAIRDVKLFVVSNHKFVGLGNGTTASQ
jgi:branched-chain amino acid transport system substrate-binding protein